MLPVPPGAEPFVEKFKQVTTIKDPNRVGSAPRIAYKQVHGHAKITADL